MCMCTYGRVKLQVDYEYDMCYDVYNWQLEDEITWNNFSRRVISQPTQLYIYSVHS